MLHKMVMGLEQLMEMSDTEDAAPSAFFGNADDSESETSESDNEEAHESAHIIQQHSRQEVSTSDMGF